MEGKSHYLNLAILVVLFFILLVLFNIESTLKNIYDDTHYTSASTDYLKNIEDILSR